MGKILDVENLVISFRTNNGKVQAVRDISFSMDKGETLAIVGESGSGKSVTAKAMLGILAPNSIVEGGRIMYDDKDLLKLSEEEFNKLRGNKITMIFQDPMSSLDPIMKIGKQMTEATLLNVKTNKKYAKKAYKRRMHQFKNALKEKKLNDANAKSIMDAFESLIMAGKGSVDLEALEIKAFMELYDRVYEGEQKARSFVKYLNEQVKLMNKSVTKKQAYEQAIKIMEDVGIKDPEKRFNQYPFEFSGGMRQRIVIAIAIAANPDILICDVPTTALDVTIQAQILELIEELKKKRKLTVIFITHDLGVVANVADKVAVMYAGKIVETGSRRDIFYHARHPYTKGLLQSIPRLDQEGELIPIAGSPPDLFAPPQGCPFTARCDYAMEVCDRVYPERTHIQDAHLVNCWLEDERAGLGRNAAGKNSYY